MNSLFVLTLLASNQLLSSATSCGLSDKYTYCSKEYNYCSIADARSGYIAYGKSGRYTLIPFTNKGGSDLTFYCGNNFGDIVYGTVKECCYIAADTEESASPLNANPPVTEGTYIDFRELDTSVNYLVDYGANGESFYRVVNNAEMYCGNSFFNDPTIGVYKECRYGIRELSGLPAPDSDEWVYCGSEYSTCTGIETSTSIPTWIRYGENDQYYYKLVYSTTGSIPCSNGFFEDPAVGVVKKCWLAETDASTVSARAAFTRKVNRVIYFGIKTFDIKKVGMVNLMGMAVFIITVMFLSIYYYYTKRKEKVQYESIV